MAMKSDGLRLLTEGVDRKLESARERGKAMLGHRKAYQTLGMFTLCDT